MRSSVILNMSVAVCAAIGTLAACPSVGKKDGPTPVPTLAQPMVRDSGSSGDRVPGPEDEILLDCDADPVVGEAPLTVRFTAEAFDPDEVKAPKFSWDFGDGATSTEANVSHTYAKPGDYVAKIKLVDGERSGNDYFDISVLPPKK